MTNADGGPRVLITGISRGFGKRLAHAFWQAGADVFGVARDHAALVAVAEQLASQTVRPGQRIEVLAADLGVASAAGEIVSSCCRSFGGIDVLICNAAIQGPIGPFWDQAFSDWESALAIDLVAPARLVHAAIPVMIRDSVHQRSILFLSGGGATNPRSNFSSYAAAKSGLVRFAETLAVELDQYGISVNSIAPGAMPTDMLGEIGIAGRERAGATEIAALTTAKVSGEATIQRAAELAVFLATSRHGITGKLISAQWDRWEDWPKHRDELNGSDVYTLRRITGRDRNKAWGDRSQPVSGLTPKISVCVYGLWHLGAVTAACLASRNIATVGLAETAAEAASLNGGVSPLFEPGLANLLKQGVAGGKLRFTDETASAIADANLVWVTFDTPVDDYDVADVEYVIERVRRIFPHLKGGAVVLISSQLPVGSIARLEQEFAAVAGTRGVSFACSPENLRLGDAIRVFTEPERIVIGIRDERARAVIEPVLRPFCETLLWMRVESAEMVKHALNSYLATCVTFTNEIASICENVSADMSEVEAALRLDPRVGEKAYVRAGAAFGGGTLARDVQFLKAAAHANGLGVPLLGAMLDSNSQHKGWVLRHLTRRLQSLAGKRIGLLGLAYKAGTDAIRRSVAIELAQGLLASKAHVVAFDPRVSALPPPLDAVTLVGSAEATFRGSDAVILATEWPEFRLLDFPGLFAMMRTRLLIDQNAFIGKEMYAVREVDYIVAGRMS